MTNHHCYEHNDVVSPDMHGERGHVISCEVGPRWQRRPRDKTSHKRLLQPVGGGCHFEFGETMSDKEALSLVNSRPGSEQKMRELSGNHIFEGPYPIKENCGGAGSDITGCCPPENLWVSSGRLQVPKPASSRATTSFKLSQTHTIIPPPPPLLPYEPHELRLPPDKIHRNPGKMSSQFRLGGPVCIDPTMPKSKSAWAKQKMLYGSMDIDTDSYPKPVVSASKARELAGHTNLFGTPPSFSPPSTPIPEHCEVAYCGSTVNPADSARQVHKTKMQALNGHNAVFLNSDPCCPPQVAKRPPLSHAKAQELKGNDIFAAIKPDNRGLCSDLQQYYDLEKSNVCQY